MKSIGTKLVFQIAVALFMVMGSFSAYGVYQQQQRYSEFLQEKERHTMKSLALILSNLLFDLERERIDNVLQSYLSAPVREIVKTAVDMASTANNTMTHLEDRSQEIGDSINVITPIA